MTRQPFVSDPDFTLWRGHALDVLPELRNASVDCCVTSPPYWSLRDYGCGGQIGLESTPDEYVSVLVEVFREVRRCLTGRGTLWLNLGDSYSAQGGGKEAGVYEGKRVAAADWQPPRSPIAGLKPKDLVGIPWRVAFALQADGWYLRSDIIWSKSNPMPESVTDRPTKAHEYVFLLSKQPRYWFDQEAVREPAEWARWGDQTVGAGSNPDGWIQPKTKTELGTIKRRGPNNHAVTQEAWGTGGGNDGLSRYDDSNGGRNIRSVWEISTQPYPEAHFAVFPEELPRRCILAGCPEGGTVLDPFGGSGTTALVARKHNRRSVLIELNEDYCRLAAKRLQQLSLLADQEREVVMGAASGDHPEKVSAGA